MTSESKSSGRSLGRWFPLLLLVVVGIVIGWAAYRQKQAEKDSQLTKDLRRPALSATEAASPKSERSPEQIYADVIRRVDLDLLLGGVSPDLYPKSLRDEAEQARLGLRDRADVDSVIRRAELALVAGDFEGALSDFRSAYALRPTDAGATRVGRLLGLVGRLDEVESFFREVLVQHPDFSRCRRELAQVLGATERLNQAVELYEAHLAKNEPDIPALCDFSLIVQLRTGQVDGAIKTLETASRLAKGTSDVAIEEQLEAALVAMARALGPMQRPQDAINLMRTALAEHPDLLDVRRELVFLLRRFGTTSEAAQVYQSLLDAGANPGIRLLHASDVLLFTGKLDRALTEFEAVHNEGKFDPGLTRDLELALAMLAAPFAQQDRLPELRSFYEKVLSQSPQLLEVRQTLARVYLEQNEPEEAIALYRNHLEANPQDTHTRGRLAMSILMGLSRFDEAEAELRRAVADAPQNGLLAADLALLLYRRDKLPEAVEVMREAIKLAPDNRVCVERFIELLDLAGLNAEADPWRRLHQQLVQVSR